MKYKLSCINPLSKRLDVSITFFKPESDPITLKLSKWRPGRYEFGNFPSQVYNVQATTQDGKPIAVTKMATHDWAIPSQYTGKLIIRYQVYANRLDAGGTYVAESFWLINPINALLSVVDNINHEVELELELPKGFEVSTSLRHSNGVWKASGYDELADSPILASAQLNKIEFAVGKKPVVLAIHGEHPLDEFRLVEDITKYTIAQSEVLPWENMNKYEYQLLFLPFRTYHGVEHMDCTTILLGPTDSDQFYEHLMGVCSHELFHYWNIKRIRPKEMSPYRYDQENYFDTGYVAEGFTTYYGDLFLVRGGVFGVDWYIGELTRLLKRHFENHGRHNASLVDSSLDLWVDGYRNEAPHRKVSIYVKGALIALMLDLTIRKSTGNQKSLDDLMLSLWKQFGPGTGGYCNEDIQAVAEEISGVELSSFFEQFIYGTAPLENVLEDLMSWVGLKVQLIHPEDQLMGYLGLKTQLSTKGYKVTSTLPDSLGESYFTSDDEIINVNGKPAQPPFNSLMVGKNSFNIIRLGKSRQIEVVLVSKAYYSSPTVSIDASASTLAHESRARWLKTGTGD